MSSFDGTGSPILKLKISSDSSHGTMSWYFVHVSVVGMNTWCNHKFSLDIFSQCKFKWERNINSLPTKPRWLFLNHVLSDTWETCQETHAPYEAHLKRVGRNKKIPLRLHSWWPTHRNVNQVHKLLKDY